MASERWPLIQADKIAVRSPHLARTRLEARTARTPRGPYSTAIACVRLSSPAFAAL
jgi:hypothetical protein